jgi:hypothetical protein
MHASPSRDGGRLASGCRRGRSLPWRVIGVAAVDGRPLRAASKKCATSRPCLLRQLSDKRQNPAVGLPDPAGRANPGWLPAPDREHTGGDKMDTAGLFVSVIAGAAGGNGEAR